MKTLISNATLVNEGKKYIASVLINDDRIEKIIKNGSIPEHDQLVDGEGMLLLPGVIDDQVHFREPGLTHKADIYSEARAAVAGGVTSYMEMPNTNPQSTSIAALEAKFARAAEVSLANYSFYIGATNTNIDEVLKADPAKVCGIKCFMGSSTGNMLVEGDGLINLFKNAHMLVATHSEEEAVIKANTEIYRQRYGEEVPIRCHPEIRSAEACYQSSSKAVELAEKYNTRLHILHLSTARELSLFKSGKPDEKHITGEVCVHHLWFTDNDYDQYGTLIKWNPAIKSVRDREALREALNDNRLDVVATDHAPHTLEEKSKTYFNAPSGGPLVQHSLPAMLELVRLGIFSYEKVVEKMCHAPALLFMVEKRGFIREGYKADLVLVDSNANDTVTRESVYYKCQWSPFEGTTFSHRVKATWVNGHQAYANGIFNEAKKGERLLFNR